MQNLSIVVPVHNGTDDLARCLASLARHRPANSTIVLVDDASTDPRVLPMLRSFAAENADVRLVEASENRGFVATVNRGAAESRAEADLLFLNTDTEVTEGWASEMQDALDAHPGAMVCCPLSNNATILSVPRFQQQTPLTFGLDAGHMASLVRAAAGETRSIAIPTPVGFCMLVRREAWQRWGPFDLAFGRGYGEEDDFGQRVQADGGVVIAATRAFVYHKGAASMGDTPEVDERKRRNWELLSGRWPQYATRTKAWCRENPMRALHERIWNTLLAPRGFENIHVLHALEHWQVSGPVRERMLRLVRATRDFALHTIVTPMTDKGAWLDAMDFEFDQGMRVVGLLDFSNRFAAFLEAAHPTLVHVHGTGWIDPETVRQVKGAIPAITTPAEADDPGRCAALYRQAAAAR